MVSEITARAILANHGKTDINLNLAAHEAAFRAFYEAHGSDVGKYSGRVWREFVVLLETMSYYAHFFSLDTVTGKWMLEDACGLDSWIEADPNDYFNFLA